jgi:hypothetical protein
VVPGLAKINFASGTYFSKISSILPATLSVSSNLVPRARLTVARMSPVSSSGINSLPIKRVENKLKINAPKNPKITIFL